MHNNTTRKLRQKLNAELKAEVNFNFRTKYSEKITWLGIEVTEKKIKPAKYQGKYFVICRKCPHGINTSSKIGKHIQYRRNGDFVIQLKANQINSFKKNHDVTEGHKWTLIHESLVPQYVHKQMIGDKECLIVTI